MSRYTETINMRVSPELKQALERAAKKQALNTSTLARSILYKLFIGNDDNRDRTLVDTPTVGERGRK